MYINGIICNYLGDVQWILCDLWWINIIHWKFRIYRNLGIILICWRNLSLCHYLKGFIGELLLDRQDSSIWQRIVHYFGFCDVNMLHTQYFAIDSAKKHKLLHYHQQKINWSISHIDWDDVTLSELCSISVVCTEIECK